MGSVYHPLWKVCPFILCAFLSSIDAGSGCLPGQRVEGDQCTDCAAGTFSNTTNSGSCTRCPAAYHQDKPQQVYCAQCEAGRLGAQVFEGNSGTCDCPNGTWAASGLNIDQDFDGNGCVLDGNDTSRGALVRTSATIRNMTFQNCIAFERHGGGIAFEAPGTLSTCSFLKNKMLSTGGSGLGARFETSGSVASCIFENNLCSNDRCWGNHWAMSGVGLFFLNSGLVSRSSFESNTAGHGSGAGAQCRGSLCEFSLCFFKGNIIGSRRGGFGGGLSMAGTVSQVKFCTFTRNEAISKNPDNDVYHVLGGGGGLCFNSGSSGVVNNSTFQSNIVRSPAASKSVHGGGAYCLNDGHTIAFRGCHFAFNMAESRRSNAARGGGLFVGESTTSEIFLCSFSSNQVGESVGSDEKDREESHGGGICFKDFSTATMKSCYFSNNSAGDGGSAHFGKSALGAFHAVQHCNFATNSAKVFWAGGHLFFGAETNSRIHACSFLGGKTTDKGGAIAFHGQTYVQYTGQHLYGRTNVTSCYFRTNSATQGGGGIHISTYRSMISNTTFYKNNGVIRVGALWAAGAPTGATDSISIWTSSFSGNNGRFSGGASRFDRISSVSIISTFFSHNTATYNNDYMPVGKGGGLFCLNIDYLNIQACTFQLNQADFGGGIFIDAPAAFIRLFDCTFDTNSIRIAAPNKTGIRRAYGTQKEDRQDFTAPGSAVEANTPHVNVSNTQILFDSVVLRQLTDLHEFPGSSKPPWVKLSGNAQDLIEDILSQVTPTELWQGILANASQLVTSQHMCRQFLSSPLRSRFCLASPGQSCALFHRDCPPGTIVQNTLGACVAETNSSTFQGFTYCGIPAPAAGRCPLGHCVQAVSLNRTLKHLQGANSTLSLQRYTCVRCPSGRAGAGFFCNGSTVNPARCTSSETTREYCPDASRNVSTRDCPAGFYCPTPTLKESCPKHQICQHGFQDHCLELKRGFLGNQTTNLPGTYCPGGTPLPINCSAGKYTANPGQSVCSTCLPGQYSFASASECHDCIPGTSSSVGKSFCSECSDGRYQALPGKSTCMGCELCEEGTRVQSNCTMTANIECSSCSAGRYASGSSGTRDSCTLCPMGHYSAAQGSFSCKPCSKGRSQQLPESTSCEACVAGRVTSTPGSTACSLCVLGTLQDTTASSVCKVCSLDMYTPRPGATECHECASDAVQTANANTCVCKAGFFESGLGLDTQQPNATQTSCLVGRRCCKACLEGSTCADPVNSLAFEGRLATRPGFFLTKIDAQILPCPYALACMGTLDVLRQMQAGNWTSAAIDQCADGHQGPLCSTCKKGWALTPSGACEPCTSQPTPAATVATTLAVTTLVAIAVLLLAFSRKTCKMTSRWRLNEIQRRRGKEITGTKKSVKETPMVDTLLAQCFTLWSYAQIIGSFGFTFRTATTESSTGMRSLTLPPVAINVCSTISAVNANFLELLQGAVPCSTAVPFEYRLVGQLLLLPCLMLAVAIAHYAAVYVAAAPPHIRESSFDHAVGWTNRAVFLLYPSVAIVCISAFVFVRVGDDLYLNSDMTILQGDARWVGAAVLAFLGIALFVIGIPATYLAVLLRREKNLDDSRIGDRYGVLLDKYEPKYWFFELVVMVFKVVMTAGVLVLRSIPIVQALLAIFVAAANVVLVLKTQPFLDGAVDVINEIGACALVLLLVLGSTNTYWFQNVDAGSTKVTTSRQAVDVLSVGAILGSTLLCLGIMAAPFVKTWSCCTSLNPNTKVVPVPTTSSMEGPTSLKEDKEGKTESTDMSTWSRESLQAKIREQKRLLDELKCKQDTAVPKKAAKGLKKTPSIDERMQSRRHLTDENHAKLIIKEHHEEHAASQRQLVQAQEASAELGSHKRLLKEIRHKMRGRVLAEVLESTLGLTGDDHIIAFDQAVRLFEAILERSLDRAVVKKTVARCDKNGDGRLDLDELRRIVGERVPLVTPRVHKSEEKETF